MAASTESDGETETSVYQVDVSTGNGDWDRLDIRAESQTEALKEAVEHGAWEIGVHGRYDGGFEHFTVFAQSLEEAEEKLLGAESDASEIIDNSQFYLGDVTKVEIRGEA